MFQVKQHACDLAGICLSHEFLNIVVDELSYHFLEVRVLGNYCRDQHEALLVVIIYCRVRVEKMVSVLLLHDRLYCWQFILHRIKHRSWLDIESHRGRRGVSWSAIVAVLIVLTTTIVEITASRATAIIIVVLVSPLRLNLILHDIDDLLNQLKDIWFLENAKIRWHALCVQPSLVVKISLIFLFMYLPFADLGDFIVSHE